MARILSGFIYTPGAPDTWLSDSDVNYQLSFDDAGEIPKAQRADFAMLMRDGYLALHADLTLKPNRPFSRAKMLRLIRQIYEKKKGMPTLQSGTAKATAVGATASACVNTEPSDWRKWASNTTRSSSIITPASI